MLAWLAANLGTIVVCALVLVIVALAARTLIRDKKQGRSPCGGSCSGCAGCGGCQSAADAKQK
ncbi:MAG: FeoB-associated Cys-rich membrane protein [Butyricicoccus sp.]|nr:FeoB-associated Cys-rich membrane protein [Butyricicoccus sp.]